VVPVVGAVTAVMVGLMVVAVVLVKRAISESGTLFTITRPS